ncbi:hypothetical protein RHMOL_Rhmol08G0247400 [Rhododendron molle]|nr:hypothetical protein RHMOL_Rhmol08G0247400 [Rhododendron molle]
MDIELPFVRGFPKPKRCTDGTARTVYYLANIIGDLQEVASSLSGHRNTIVYEACADFREKYGHIFPVGSITVWDSVEAMLRWADKMIWFSFLIRSHERHLRTSCFPSTMSTKQNIMQFGYYCGSGKCMFKAFGKQFRDFFRYAGADAHEVHLRMRNRWWTVPRINNRADRASLGLFFNALNLGPLDFLLVTAFDATDVNVIVFTGDGIERLYSWT